MATITCHSEPSSQTVIDIVFIHGLMGDEIQTWEWTDPDEEGDYSTFWPRDLSEELNTAAVWTVGYDSSPTKWKGRNMPLLDRANSLLDLLDAHGIGSRPVVFVTHSLGGLLAKAIVRASADTPDQEEKHNLHLNVRGFVFFSTPHTGSSIANLGKSIPGGRPSEILTELARNDAYLRDLSQWFADNFKKHGWESITYFEAFKTLGVTVVDPVSANPGCGRRPVPFDGDHFSICKIPDVSDHRFRQVAKLARSVVERIGSSERRLEEEPIEGVDFEVGVLPNPPQDGRVVEFHPPSRTLTYTSRASREALAISPSMRYQEAAASGLPIDPLEYFWNPFRCQFPALDVVLVNNSDKTLVLVEAVLEVAISKPDFSPLIVLPSNTWGMKLQIKNEGWGKISNAKLRCNLLPTQANGYMPDPPIDHIEIGEEFSHSFEIGDFAESAEVDLRDTLRDLGVDIDAIDRAPKRSQMIYAMNAMQRGEDTRHAKHMGRFPDMKDDKAWSPFPDGYVVVAGLLEFDAADADGEESHHSLPIRARVFMFDVRFDQPMPPSYQYSAELEHTGVDYKVPVKLSQTLKPGEADRFTIRLACTQSAFHEFRIRWRFVGGLCSRSYPIRLHQLIPRTFSVEQAESVENSGFDPETADGQVVETGDCVEQSLMMAMSVAQARAQGGQQEE